MAKTILWFSASYCAPCRQLQPIMDAIADDYPFDKFEIDTHENGLTVAQQWQVSSVPTLILLENSTEIGRSIGVKSEKDLREWIENCSYEAWVKEHGEKPILEIG